MNWWEWVFSGIGVLAIALLIEWLRRRSRSSGHEATITAQGARVSDSPVASGSGITQNVNSPTTIHVNLPHPAPARVMTPPQPEPVRVPREDPRSQIIATATRVIRVSQTDRTEWSDRGPYFNQDAVVIQFTNEAAPSYRNSQPIVRASLVYSDEHNHE